MGSDALVVIDFSARDEGPAGLHSAYFYYDTPLGGFIRVDSSFLDRDAEGSYTASKTVGIWAASGNYVLDKIEVLDLEGNRTTYERESAPQFDFASADFRVDNPLEDTTAPTVSFVRLFQDKVRQGQPVVALYGAADDLSGIDRISIAIWTPTGNQHHITSLPELGAVGPATWLVPFASPAGSYDAFAIIAEDRAGNSIHYSAERTYAYPPKATLPAHDHPDPNDADFTVEGVVGDRTPPQLTSLSMLTPEERHLGDQVALDYTAYDEGTGIMAVAAQWTDGRGHAIDSSKVCGDTSRGPVTNTIEDYRSLGTRWELQLFAIGDHLFNQVVYRRDGTIEHKGGDPGPTTHTFDLSQGDFDLTDGAPSPHDYPQMDWCPNLGQVSLEVPDPTIAYGETVTPVGEVLVAGAPLPEPIVAIHEYADGVPALIGVVAGNGKGQFETNFIAERSVTLKATFLGVSGPRSSDVTESPSVDIFVHTNIDVSLDKYFYRVGDRASLTGRAQPFEIDDKVILERDTGSGWQTVKETSIGNGGSFSFTVQLRRPGIIRYRVVLPSMDAVSDTQTLKVHKRHKH